MTIEDAAQMVVRVAVREPALVSGMARLVQSSLAYGIGNVNAAPLTSQDIGGLFGLGALAVSEVRAKLRAGGSYAAADVQDAAKCYANGDEFSSEDIARMMAQHMLSDMSFLAGMAGLVDAARSYGVGEHDAPELERCDFVALAALGELAVASLRAKLRAEEASGRRFPCSG